MTSVRRLVHDSLNASRRFLAEVANEAKMARPTLLKLAGIFMAINVVRWREQVYLEAAGPVGCCPKREFFSPSTPWHPSTAHRSLTREETLVMERPTEEGCLGLSRLVGMERTQVWLYLPFSRLGI